MFVTPPWIFQSTSVCIFILVITATTPPPQKFFFNHPLLENVMPLILATWYQPIYLSIAKLPISSKLLLKRKFNTVRNRITIYIYIVIINKNGMDRFNTPSKLRLSCFLFLLFWRANYEERKYYLYHHQKWNSI